MHDWQGHWQRGIFGPQSQHEVWIENRKLSNRGLSSQESATVFFFDLDCIICWVGLKARFVSLAAFGLWRQRTMAYGMPFGFMGVANTSFSFARPTGCRLAMEHSSTPLYLTLWACAGGIGDVGWSSPRIVREVALQAFVPSPKKYTP